MDEEDKHYCHCQAGYTGSYCEEEVDECSPNPCQNGATCTDYLGGFSCKVWAVLGWREGISEYPCRRAFDWELVYHGRLRHVRARCHTPVQDPVILQMCWRRGNTPSSSGLGHPFPIRFHGT